MERLDRKTESLGEVFTLASGIMSLYLTLGLVHGPVDLNLVSEFGAHTSGYQETEKRLGTKVRPNYSGQ